MITPSNWIIYRKVCSALLAIIMLIPGILPLKIETDRLPEDYDVIVSVYSFHVEVDKEKLMEKYEKGRWDGSKKTFLWYSAEIIDGKLVTNNEPPAEEEQTFIERTILQIYYKLKYLELTVI